MAAPGRGYRGGEDDDDDDAEKRRKKRRHADERDAPADGEPEKRPPRKAKSRLVTSNTWILNLVWIYHFTDTTAYAR